MASEIEDDVRGKGPEDEGTLATSLNLWPEEYLEGWEPERSRLFLPALAGTELGTHTAVRISIRGTGIAATVDGPVVGARRIGSSALVPGVFLALAGRGASAASYLERVARGQPVDFNERDPRYSVSWRVGLRHGKWRLQARTLNVSHEGCSVTWPGPPPTVGDPIHIWIRALLGPTLAAEVCWAGTAPGGGTAGLRLKILGRSGRKWRSAVDRAAEAGAPVV